MYGVKPQAEPSHDQTKPNDAARPPARLPSTSTHPTNNTTNRPCVLTLRKSRKFSTWGLVPVVEKSPAWTSTSPGGSSPGRSSASCRLCVSAV